MRLNYDLTICTWNARGLGRREKERAVQRLMRECKVKVCLIQESKLNVAKQGLCRKIWGNRHWSCESVPAVGSAGGLITSWDNSFFRVTKTMNTSRAICLFGILVSSNLEVGIVNVYAPNDLRERREFWTSLKLLIEQEGVPIIVGGDFNAVRRKEESLGGMHSSASIMDFNAFISDCCLIDLPFIGGEYTWYRGGNNVAASRIDRFLLSTEVVACYPGLVQKRFPRGLSDHCPIWLNNLRRVRGPQPFKLFDWWMDDPAFEAQMIQALDSGDSIPGLLGKVKAVSKDWLRRKKADETDSISDLEKKVDEREEVALANPENLALWDEIRELRALLWERC
ncbi:hypothetical protein HRI_000190800 [Hibiscus trionum]|uniref:Endonuclease/exonuclease/phosphatase domain-containing protein n=1 Tax=Hibiscus trionum TaxID=183268 RepID=A0A9W7GWI7_HIBTR|nr:hypothetical protein HRI_000190800 [Hibiscus trionum]